MNKNVQKALDLEQSIYIYFITICFKYFFI